MPTGLVLGLGNLALVCLAGAVAAFPVFRSGQTAFGLLLASLKHSLTAPVFFLVFLQRPRLVLAVGLLIFSTTLFLLLNQGVCMDEFIKGLGAGQSALARWENENESVSLPVHFTGLARQTLPILSFIILFIMTLRWNDLLKIFAGTMLITLLPIHHRFYDLVTLAPILAIMLREIPLIWSAGLTMLLSGLVESALKRQNEFFNSFQNYYYLFLLLALYGLLAWLDKNRSPAVARRLHPLTAYLRERP